MSIYNENLQLDSDFTSQQYSQPPAQFIQPVVEGGNTIVTNINGASGPNITLGSGIGFGFSGGAGGTINMVVTNAALVRSSIGAAASGVNTDITQLNGASQVDVSGQYEVAGTQVVGAQQPAIPDSVDPTTNLILAALRAHGLIDT